MAATHSSEEPLLHRMQQRAFAYFINEANPRNGLVLDKTAPHWPASIAATGLALSCYPVGVERGFISRSAAIARTLATLRFFRDSVQGTGPDATGYRGFYYHFLGMHDGRRAWNCELSTVDSAFLVAGMLCAARYFDGDRGDEREIREIARALYERIDWRWAANGGRTMCHGWKPERGFLRFRWEGYDEAMLLYLLALGSPTFALAPDAWEAWTSSYEWMNCYDIDYLYAGPLFTHQLSHTWIDFRGIRDAYMREKGIDYFGNSRRATLIQQRYAIDNPQRYSGYGADAWGITASDGPGPSTRRIGGIQRRFYDYEGRGAPYGLDDGTLAPWAVVASIPFAPEIVLQSIDHCIRTLDLHDPYRYGFRATFNATFGESGGRGAKSGKGGQAGQAGQAGSGAAAPGWVSRYHFGLNLGPNVLMIENFRSGLVWKLMRSCTPIVDGLRRAGFEDGWLSAGAPAH